MPVRGYVCLLFSMSLGWSFAHLPKKSYLTVAFLYRILTSCQGLASVCKCWFRNIKKLISLSSLCFLIFPTFTSPASCILGLSKLVYEFLVPGELGHGVRSVSYLVNHVILNKLFNFTELHFPCLWNGVNDYILGMVYITCV